MSRDTEDDLHRLAGRDAQVRALVQIFEQRRSKAGEQAGEADVLIAEIENGARTGILEQALDGANYGPGGIGLGFVGFPSVETIVAANGGEGGEPIRGGPISSFEGDERKISAVDRCNNGAVRPEINAQLHFDSV